MLLGYFYCRVNDADQQEDIIMKFPPHWSTLLTKLMLLNEVCYYSVADKKLLCLCPIPHKPREGRLIFVVIGMKTLKIDERAHEELD